MIKALTVNPEFRLHYHAMPPSGWINDPNGFCRYKDRYHLFAQYHPYGTQWGPMHWGHWESKDLIQWDWQGIIMAPDQPFDHAGCFSGTALKTDDGLILMYTGVSENEHGSFQNQCIAQSADALTADKWPENPVISARELPNGASPHDFRDPKLMKTKDGYVALVASQGEKGGQLLSFFSKDLKKWAYRDVFFQGIGDMPECPDYFEMDGQSVLISCVINLPSSGLDYPNAQPAVYMLGRTNEQRTVFHGQRPVALDYGLDFYAPQTAFTADGRCVMIAWMCCWGHISPTHYLSHGWCGAMTVPRELRIEQGRLLQAPARELEARQSPWRVHDPVRLSEGACYTFSSHTSARIRIKWTEITAGQLDIRVMQSGSESFLILYDVQAGVLHVDRSHCGYTMGPDGAAEAKPRSAAAVPLSQDGLMLDILMDTCSVEIFVNGGAAVLTSLAFPREHGTGVSLSAAGGGALADVQDCEITVICGSETTTST